MKLSVELVDLIFSFLVTDRRTLFTCSEVPALSQIVERHLYHFITVYFQSDRNGTDPTNPTSPTVLSRFISENPRILRYVRVLRIQVILDHHRNIDDDRDLDIKQDLDNFAKTLLMFPVLECIKLTTSTKRLCSWPDVFRAALEDRLSLPTLKELHIVGNQDFPCSLIDNRENIEDLLVSGDFSSAERDVCISTEATLPQLKSLALLSFPYHRLFRRTIIPHANKLQSLKCASSAVELLPKFLGICSQTLNKLDIDFSYSGCKIQVSSDGRRCYPELLVFSRYTLQTGEVDHRSLQELQLSPIPSNLQQLTISVEAWVERDGKNQPTYGTSYLPAAAKVINTFASSVQRLIIEIDLRVGWSASFLALLDFSPLAVLGTAACLSIPRIDLYAHTDTLPATITLAQLLSSLAAYDNIMKMIEEGKLVIHPEETAPEYVRVRED